jgi:osmotically-inducible protein OsmY/hypoxanthine phosphoribosyltransferase
MGAIGPGGIRILDEAVLRLADVPPAAVEAVARREQLELERRERSYRGGSPVPQVRNRTIILVDDGLATGSTLRAAIAALRRRGPQQIVVAVPVGASESCADLESEADEVICAHPERWLLGVGEFYRDFSQTTDAQVCELLERARKESAEPPSGEDSPSRHTAAEVPARPNTEEKSPMNAQQLQDSVRSQLRYDPQLDSSEIRVETTASGVVTLSGTVRSYLEKVQAETAAKRVAGVRGVANELVVMPLGEQTRSDAEIAEAAVNGLRWRAAIPEDRIQVLVSDGWLTLEGEVQQRFQKQEAERVVRQLRGVVGVTNHVRLAPPIEPKPELIRSDIEAALVRSARLHASGIHVQTEGARVILAGSVRTWEEAEEAEDVAWSAPGVADVESRLEVLP